MSKFVLLFCAFLLFGVVSAEHSTTQTKKEVQEIKNKLIHLINDAIKQINENVQKVQEETSKYAQKLIDAALQVVKSVYDNIISAQKKVTSEIEKLIKEAVDVNVMECSKMAEAFNQENLQALAEASRCVTDIIEDADGYIENIIHTSNIILENLTSIKEEAEVCVKEVDGIKSAAKALYCVNLVTAKGTWTATKEVPSHLTNMGKLSFKITTLLPELTVCSAVKGVKKVNKNSREIVEKVKECVETQKASANANKI